MRCECPTFKRCCLCIPLRFGLVGTGWIKLVFDVFYLILFSNHIHHLIHSRRHDLPVILQVMLILTVMFLCADVIFSVLLLYGCHKKDSVILRVFYRYCLFVLVTNIVWVFTMIIADIVVAFVSPLLWIFTVYPLIISALFFIVGILLNWYITMLVRSEVMKLEDSSHFQFTNFAGGACAMADENDVEKSNTAEEETQKSDMK